MKSQAGCRLRRLSGSGNFAPTRESFFTPVARRANPWLRVTSKNGRKTASSPMLHKGISKAYGEGLDSLSECEGVEVLFRAPDETGECGCRAGASVFSTDSESFYDEGMVEEAGPSTLLVFTNSA